MTRQIVAAAKPLGVSTITSSSASKDNASFRGLGLI